MTDEWVVMVPFEPAVLEQDLVIDWTTPAGQRCRALRLPWPMAQLVKQAYEDAEAQR